MKYVIASLYIAIISLCGIANSTDPIDKPRVVFIVVDDLNDWLGCYNVHPNAHTPNIDNFAAKAVRFTQAYCSVAICSPSRISMLTGKAPWTSGIYGNNILAFRGIPGTEDYTTLPEMLKNNGYTTVTAGKVFHNPHPPDVDPISWTHTFNKYGIGSGPPANKHSHGFHAEMPSDWFRDAFDFGSTNKQLEQTADYKNAMWVSEQLATIPGPAFIAYGGFLPHLPWNVPQEFIDMHPLEGMQLPPILDADLEDIYEHGAPKSLTAIDDVLRSHNKRLEAVRGYTAAVSFADACVGKVLDSVADTDIVIITSDHGWHLGEKRAWSKFKPWERSVRVPFLMRVPGLTPNGAVCNSPISLMDVFPTIISLCDIETDYQLDGEDISDLLQSPQLVKSRAVVTVSTNADWYSIRDYQYRLIYRSDGVNELYDMINDPNEWDNLVRKPHYAPIVAGLQSHIPQIPAAKK